MLDDSLNNTFCHELHIDLITIAYIYNSLEQRSYFCIYEGDTFFYIKGETMHTMSEPGFESPFATVSKIGHFRSLH